MRDTKTNKPAFPWSGLFVLLPLALLAGVGLYSLRQDRFLAEAEAREQCRALTQLCAQNLSDRLTGDSNTFGVSKFIVDEQGLLVAVAGSTNRARAPILAPRPLPLAKLSLDQAALWRDASAAELVRKDPATAVAVWRQFLSLAPSSPFTSLARYNLALLSTNHAESVQLLTLVDSDDEATTESGLPLRLLAEWKRWELQPSATAAQTLASNAVCFPSFISPSILQRLNASFPASAWQDAWDSDQSARELFTAVSAKLREHRSAFWTRFHGEYWLIQQQMMPDASREVTAIPFLAALGIAYNALGLGDTASSHQAPQNDLPEMNTNQVSAIISSPLSVAPPYATVVAEIAGKPLVGVKKTGTPANLDISGGILARATIGDAAVTAYLTNPALLYGAQRRRTLWFTAIILISALAATAALIALHRNFLQQVRLGEMKTNFVSSVSHELRAPIASMRLLAEGLDRGKISDPPRQQEYYKLLAQESRRLSTLIENILDYSRIDSGRKTYEKEPADLPALVQQTIALMTPAAADRRVSLIAPAPNALADTSVVCDGLAIQQALINLLDNAIKHSPPDSAVTIGLERLNGDVSLSVQDSGPGIPLDEREKILERFYRRGTELRRETQGIGIGLTIVKHIIEGHHGRVLVAGDMGQGSRFTLQWPANGGPDPA